MFQKIKPWKSESYLEWIRSQPCEQCNNGERSDPHHLIGVGSMSGVGMTAPDWAAIPLCRSCHDEMHRKSVFWDYQWELISRTLGRAISAGKFKWRK